MDDYDFRKIDNEKEKEMFAEMCGPEEGWWEDESSQETRPPKYELIPIYLYDSSPMLWLEIECLEYDCEVSWD